MIRYAIHRPDGETVVTSSARIAQDEWEAGAEVVRFEWDGPATEIPLAVIPRPERRREP